MSFMTTIAEMLGLITPSKPLEKPNSEEVHCLKDKVHEQLHERELATARIAAATDAQVREADVAIRAVQGVLSKIEKKPRRGARNNR